MTAPTELRLRAAQAHRRVLEELHFDTLAGLVDARDAERTVIRGLWAASVLTETIREQQHRMAERGAA